MAQAGGAWRVARGAGTRGVSPCTPRTPAHSAATSAEAVGAAGPPPRPPTTATRNTHRTRHRQRRYVPHRSHTTDSARGGVAVVAHTCQCQVVCVSGGGYVDVRMYGCTTGGGTTRHHLAPRCTRAPRPSAALESPRTGYECCRCPGTGDRRCSTVTRTGSPGCHLRALAQAADNPSDPAGCGLRNVEFRLRRGVLGDEDPGDASSA